MVGAGKVPTPLHNRLRGIFACKKPDDGGCRQNQVLQSVRFTGPELY